MKTEDKNKNFPDKYLPLKDAAEMFSVNPRDFMYGVVPRFPNIIHVYKKTEKGRHYKFSLWEVHDAIQADKEEQRLLTLNKKQYENAIS